MGHNPLQARKVSLVPRSPVPACLVSEKPLLIMLDWHPWSFYTISLLHLPGPHLPGPQGQG